MSISIWEPGRPAGQPVSQKPLRTGDRIEIGDWTLSYFREEFADHGIPGGGRDGGDQHPVQEEPRLRSTSPEGGSDRTADDPRGVLLAAAQDVTPQESAHSELHAVIEAWRVSRPGAPTG